MTGQTGPGDFNSGFKILLQYLVPGMIGGIPGGFGFGCLLGHGPAGGFILTALSSDAKAGPQYQATGNQNDIFTKSLGPYC
jgi:hypothetical protein